MARFHFETESVAIAERILAVFTESESPVPHRDPLDKRRLSNFYRSLTDAGREFVSVVVRAKDRPIGRAELRAVVTINGRPIGDEDDKFKGVTGGVGVAWNKFFPNDRNPFSGKYDPARGEQVYQVDTEQYGALISPLPPER